MEHFSIALATVRVVLLHLHQVVVVVHVAALYFAAMIKKNTSIKHRSNCNRM